MLLLPRLPSFFKERLQQSRIVKVLNLVLVGSYVYQKIQIYKCFRGWLE